MSSVEKMRRMYVKSVRAWEIDAGSQRLFAWIQHSKSKNSYKLRNK
jgi:uncharacterized heparinase superfamily protein